QNERTNTEPRGAVDSGFPRRYDEIASRTIERKLDRYYEAFESGELSAADCRNRVYGHRARLETPPRTTSRPHRSPRHRRRRAARHGRPRPPTRRHPRQRKAANKQKHSSAYSSKKSASTT